MIARVPAVVDWLAFAVGLTVIAIIVLLGVLLQERAGDWEVRQAERRRQWDEWADEARARKDLTG